MGSEKYPDENEYDAFLAKHGGSSNAFTELVSRRFSTASRNMSSKLNLQCTTTK